VCVCSSSSSSSSRPSCALKTVTGAEQQALPIAVFGSQLDLLHKCFILRIIQRLCYMQKMSSNSFVQLCAP